MKGVIPERTLMETGLPVAALHELARREGNAKKPIFEMHKWWARRLGSVFRALLVAATLPARRGEKESTKARRLLAGFYQRGRLGGMIVLDPFMGGGTSVVEARKLGARVVGVDVDPVAWFVTRQQVERISLARIRRAYTSVSRATERDLRALYQTYDAMRHRRGEIVNAFWVTRLRCGACRRAFDAHPHYRLAYDDQRKSQEVFCAHCGAVRTIPLKQKSFKCMSCSRRTHVDRGTVHNGRYECPRCGSRGDVRPATGKPRPRPKRLFAIEYTIAGIVNAETGKALRFIKKASRRDVERYRYASVLLRSAARRLPYPRALIFRRGRYDRRPISYGYRRYAQLFNDRQLYCLSRVYKEIANLRDKAARSYLLLALSDSLAANNQLVGYAFGYRKSTPLFGIHGYHVVQRPVEGNVWGNPHFGRGSFSRCVGKLLLGKDYARQPYEFAYSAGGEPIRTYVGETCESRVRCRPDGWLKSDSDALLLNRSSLSLSPIKSGCVDLIVTDPPFYDNLPYSELSDFYFQWLRPFMPRSGGGLATRTPIRESLFVRRKNEREHERYRTGITRVLRECARVLRPSGLMVFTYHHREPSAWHALGRAVAQAGFIVTAVSPMLAEGKSGYHSYEGTPKWDSVICCRLNRTLESNRAKPTRLTIRRELQDWLRRIQPAVDISGADRLSIALSLAMKAAVNARLGDVEYARLLKDLATTYRIKGVWTSVPGVSVA